MLVECTLVSYFPLEWTLGSYSQRNTAHSLTRKYTCRWRRCPSSYPRTESPMYEFSSVLVLPSAFVSKYKTSRNMLFSSWITAADKCKVTLTISKHTPQFFSGTLVMWITTAGMRVSARVSESSMLRCPVSVQCIGCKVYYGGASHSLYESE